ncbi:MAG TPA: helix-turn-helix transcriptional regulator [Burkholderiaceae bacterium]|nr:helix-turn-helix transcriptional regulator [Burkholderiaceae bacterium]
MLTLDATAMAEGDAAGAGNALRVLFSAPQVFALDAGSPDVERLQTLFEALEAESRAGDGDGGPVPMWLARSIVWRLAQVGRRRLQADLAATRGRQSIYTRWLVLLEAHFREHWPVTRYANQLGMSPERLNRIVRAETGQNVQQQIHARLAREATRLLVHVAAPVSRLGFELGFDDPAYFCRFVKRHTGMSPREYRVRMLQD